MEPTSAESAPDDVQRHEALARSQRLENLGALAGRAAHDFNNVLGVVLGYVELARMGLGGEHPKAAHYLDKALETVDRAREISDGILDAARDSMRRRPDLAVPEQAVTSACALLARTLDSRIELVVSADAGAPITPLDEPTLQQVILGLCISAARALPEGGRLEVGVRGVEVEGEGGLPPGSYAVLRVADNGPGVPGDLHERIFEPSYSEASDARGGQGLTLARALVERFGGRLEAGGDDAGAVFQVWLPSALRVREAREEDAAASDVLIVDADPQARDVMRAYLEADGHPVREAGSAAEALASVVGGGVAVALVDERLPDARGTDLVWRAAALPRAPRLVVLGAGEGTVLPRGSWLLDKPFLRDDLTRVLREALGNAPG